LEFGASTTPKCSNFYVLLLLAPHSLIEVSERSESPIRFQMLNSLVFQNSCLGKKAGVIGKTSIGTNDDGIIFLRKREHGSLILEDDFTKDKLTFVFKDAETRFNSKIDFHTTFSQFISHADLAKFFYLCSLKPDT
jgi:hypothetical protein